MVSVRYLDLVKNIKEVSGEYLKLGTDTENFCRMMKKLFRMTDDVLRSEITEQELFHVACTKGCCYCCRVNVPVLIPEAALIACYIRSVYRPSVIGRLISEMHSFILEIAGYDEEERIASNKKCVFLGRFGECTIHNVRPFACRSVTSADSEACRQAMRQHLFDEHILVPMNIKHKSINDSAFIGLAESLKENGLDDRSFEITSKVLEMLE